MPTRIAVQLVFIFLLTSSSLKGQTPLSPDTAEAHQAFVLGSQLIKEGKAREALVNFELALQKFDQVHGPLHETRMRCLEGIVLSLVRFRDWKGIEARAKETLELIDKLKSDNTYLTIKIRNNLSIALSELGKYKESHDNLLIASNILNELEGDHPKLKGKLLLELGILNKKQRRYNEATNFYLLALENFKSESDSLGVGNCLHNLGNISQAKFDYARARHYYREALTFYDPSNYRSAAFTLHAISLTYKYVRAYELSLQYLQLAEQNAIASFGANHSYTKNLTFRIGETYSALGRFEKAAAHLSTKSSLEKYPSALLECGRDYLELKDQVKAKEYTLKSLNPEIANASDSLHGMSFYAKLLMLEDRLDEAELIYNENLKTRLANVHPKHKNIQYGYFSIARLEYQKGNYENAKLILDSLLVSENNMWKLLSNGDSIRSQHWDDIHQYKTRMLHDYHKKHPSDEAWLMAKNSAIEWLNEKNKARAHAGIPGSVMSLEAGRSEVVDMLMDLLYDKYAASQDELSLGEALFYTDYVRDLLWVDVVKNRQAADISTTYLSALNNENTLRKEIARLELIQRFSSDSIIITSNIVDLKSQLQDENNSRFKFKESALEGGLALLNFVKNKNQAVVSFFIAEAYLYRIFVYKDQSQMIRIPWNNKYNDLIRNTANQLAQNNSNLDQALKDVSELLLSNLNIKNSTPIQFYLDGALHNIPFELLPFGESSDPLVFHHPISYNTSFKRANFNFKTQDYSHILTGFAPSYKKWKIAKEDTSSSVALASLVRHGMSELPAAREEVRSITNNVSGQSFIDDEATVTNFLKSCGSSKVLHMSMHAMAEAQQPALSRLVFSPDELDNPISRYCFAGEIAVQDIPAELVVLSACNTGRGEFFRGDGVLSLARAFEYAGAQSTVFSLWRIPDAATGEIMDIFYKELLNNKTRAEALRNAKLAYIAKHKNTSLSAPYYWAGFVLNGESSELDLSSPKYIIPKYVLGLFLVLLLTFLLFRRFKK